MSGYSFRRYIPGGRCFFGPIHDLGALHIPETLLYSNISRNYYFSITYHTYRSSSHMYLYFPAVTSHFIRNRVPERFLIFLLFFAVMIRQYNDKIYIDISKSWYLVSYSWVSFGRGWVFLHGICPYVNRMGTSHPSNRLVNRVGPPKGPIAFVDLSSSALYVRILSRFEFIEIHN